MTWALALLTVGVTLPLPANAAPGLKVLAPIETLPAPADPAPSPPPGEGPRAFLGTLLAVDGRTIIAGVASGHAAYAYRESSPAHWRYEGMLLGPDGSVFFSKACIRDGVALVSGSIVNGAGFVYVFRRVGREWQFVQKLLEPEPEADTMPAYFGSQMAFGGDIAVVSNFTDRNSFGAVYVYRKTSNGRFTYEEKLSADDGSEFDSFGWSVATDGEQILVGSQGSGGAAYVFRRVHGVWKQEQKLTSPASPASPALGEDFGFSVAISGRTAVIASPDYGYVGQPLKNGAAFVFVQRGNTWGVEQTLVDPLPSGGLFGQAVALQGGQILVSAWGGTDASLPERVYFFDRMHRAEWTPTLVMSEGNGGNSFGYELALSDSVLITSALALPAENPAFQGQVFVYELPRSRDDGHARVLEH